MKVCEVPENQAVAFAIANPEKAVEIAKGFPAQALSIASRVPSARLEIVRALPETALNIAKSIWGPGHQVNYQSSKSTLESVKSVIAINPSIAADIAEHMFHKTHYDGNGLVAVEIAIAFPESADKIAGFLAEQAAADYHRESFEETVLVIAKKLPQKAVAIAKMMPPKAYDREWGHQGRYEPDSFYPYDPRVKIALAVRDRAVAIAKAIPETALEIAKYVNAGEVALAVPEHEAKIAQVHPWAVEEICRRKPGKYSEYLQSNVPEIGLGLARAFPDRITEIIEKNPKSTTLIAKEFPEKFRLE